MRNRIRAHEAFPRLIEVIEYTHEDDPFLYTVIFDDDSVDSPRITSFEVEREENPNIAKSRALELFKQGVLEIVALDTIEH